jgi:hypothetical protein
MNVAIRSVSVRLLAGLACIGGTLVPAVAHAHPGHDGGLHASPTSLFAGMLVILAIASARRLRALRAVR